MINSKHYMGNIKPTKETSFGAFTIKSNYTPLISEAYFSESIGQCNMRISKYSSKFEATTTVYSYRFPDGEAEMLRILDLFKKQMKSRTTLPDGVKFSQELLRNKFFESNFIHEAFPINKNNLVHIYKSESFGFIIRFIKKSGNMLDEELFKYINENMKFNNKWVTDLPEVETKELAQISSSPIQENIYKEILSQADFGLDLISASKIDSPSEIARKVHEFIETRRPLLKATSNTAIALGSLWGECLKKECGWEWRQIQGLPSPDIIALCHPNLSHTISPMNMMGELLKSKSKKESNSLLKYNIIKEGNLPISEEKSYLWI